MTVYRMSPMTLGKLLKHGRGNCPTCEKPLVVKKLVASVKTCTAKRKVRCERCARRLTMIE